MIDNQISHEEQFEADLFYQALGRTMGRWSTIEYYLGLMFTKITNMEADVARSVFHSARSWRGRYDMLSGGLEASASRPGLVESWRMILDTANKYSAFRNVLAHDHVQLCAIDKARNVRLLVIRPPKASLSFADPAPLYHRNHIETAGENFHLLGAVITHALAHQSGDQLGSPERLRWLVDQLPNPPHASKVAQNVAEQFSLGLERQAFPH